MKFSNAVNKAKTGAKIRRPGWPNLEYLMLVDGLLYGKRYNKVGMTYFGYIPQEWIWATNWEVVNE